MRLTSLTIAMLVGLSACEGHENSDSLAPALAATKPKPASNSRDTAAGISWIFPATWNKQGRKSMRVATYQVPKSSGDSEDGQCTVHFFGPDQGGSVEANLQRWYGQIQQPDGKPTSEVAQRDERVVGQIKITRVDILGTYRFKPFPMAPKATLKPGFRLLGAVAAAPQGHVFFKLTAPVKTAAIAMPDFDAMLDSIRKQ